MRKQLLTLSAVAVLACSSLAFLSSCNNSGSNTTNSGNLVVYSTQTDKDIELCVNAFKTKYPDISVEVVNGSAGELRTRIEAEADNPQGDVMWGGLNQGDGSKYANLFEQYTSPNNKYLYTDYQTDNGCYNYPNVQVVNLIVNTKVCSELGVTINGYTDLLDSKLKGKVVSADPTSSSSAWRHLTTILGVMGTQYTSTSTVDSLTDQWGYIEKLMPNLVISSSSSSVYKTVAQGEYAVGLSYEDGDAQLIIDGAPDTKLVYMSEGTTACAFGLAVVKGAKNMDNAKLFTDFMLSKDLQEARNAGLKIFRSTNKEVAFDDTYIPSYDKIKLVKEDYTWLAKNKTDIVNKWTALWTKVNG